MTVVSLIGAMLGAQTDADAGVRSDGGSGTLFGDAFAAAGRKFEEVGGGSSTSPDLGGEGDTDPTDGAAAGSETSTGVDAAVTALLQLAAQLPAAVQDAAPSTEDEGAVDDRPEQAESDVASQSVEVFTTPAAESALSSMRPIASLTSGDDDLTTPESPAARADKTDGADVLVPTSSSSASTAPQLTTAASPTPAPDSSSARSDAALHPLASFAAAASPAGPVSGAAADAGAVTISTATSARVEPGERVPSTPSASSAPSAPAAIPLATPAPTIAAAASVAAPDAGSRAVATQVSPVVVSIAQRPTGTHHLTMTVNPDTLGPVTVRAHISATGEVQVELSGATDAGRDALRGILLDLRRDLSAVMPHATLSVAQGSTSDATGDRSGQQGAGGAAGDQGAGDREADRGRSPQRTGAERAPEVPRPTPTTPHAGVGAGLDIFA